MKEIPLTQGCVALVDDEDYEALMQFEWVWSNGYAVRAGQLADGTRTTVRMHRQLLGCVPGDGVLVDHRDENKLNNRRENLRQCTSAQNLRNRGLTRASTTGLKGVTWDKRKRRWKGTITVNYKTKNLGLFATPEAAHAAYCAAADALHEEFANHGRKA